MSANALRWDGGAGHYEVYYLTVTDPASGCGLWIRYTMVAPLAETGEEATCSLWFMAMDPQDPGRNVGLKESWPVSRMTAATDPFRLEIAEATLADDGMRGEVGGARWDLRWSPAAAPHRHVHPVLERAKIAKTVLVLPHGNVPVSGTVSFGGRTLQLDGAPGGQAHIWGSKHATRWAWAHCGDFHTVEGEPRPGSFLDGVSVYVPRFGREMGPNTPVVGRVLDRDFCATAPLHVLRAPSRFALTTWAFAAHDGNVRIEGEVDARREDLVGVTYHDPDGELAYCYNTEVASMRVHVYERPRRGAEWALRETLVSDGRAHFEYAQRDTVPGLPLLVK